MANLMISTLCNQDCPYCFTADYRNLYPLSNRHFLSLADVENRLNFLMRSNIDQARLMGGEPTLHPQFVELVACVRMAGLKVVVFSNGLIPASVLDCLASLPVSECMVLINVSDPQYIHQNISTQQLDTIQRLGTRAMLGFNIYRPDFQLDFLLPIVAETGCRPSIRLGIAHPCLSASNQYIHPNQYVAVGAKIARFARLAASAGVTIEFDCGFVRCMFSEPDWEALCTLKADVGRRCNPILDIDIEGRVMHCYPLAGLGSLPMTADSDAPALRQAFELRVQPYRRAGIFPECSCCSFKAAGECSGGCLSATIRRFRRAPSASLVVPRQGIQQ
ncbi:MAG: radical SAM protein [Anaerolineae bacterium]|nr:radical SAM protein [Anaerolineae bacterium]